MRKLKTIFSFFLAVAIVAMLLGLLSYIKPQAQQARVYMPNGERAEVALYFLRVI